MKFEGHDVWIGYAKLAWDAAGRPPGLNPSDVLTNPMEYDRSYYDYFERRYVDMWLAIYSRVNPVDGSLLKRESEAFRESWSRNFYWETVWKQTLPFLVYGTTLGVRNNILVELSSLYCIGQAIPSVVIDRTLDDPTAESSDSDAAFCMLSYAKALRGLRALELPNGSVIEDDFVNLTEEMYERMLVERHGRFGPIPHFVADAISEYFLPNSRLLSSIFFGVLPLWAHTLANRTPSQGMIRSTEALRTVRQLNDEILDVHTDIRQGLLTLPWLYALEEQADLRKEIETLWKDTTSSKALSKCRKILDNTRARERSALKSLGLLSESMNVIREIFPARVAFDVTLLHNIRWALLNWSEQVNYNRKPKTIRQPRIPTEIILEADHTIEPVPGGGVVVFNGTNKVLMSLLLKRGMLRWELPAGVVKGSESLEETAEREALEETGRRIQIGDAMAVCWHYSRMLNKGWMGVIFRGTAIDNGGVGDLMVVSREAFNYGKFNIRETPDLYYSCNISDVDFEELLKLCESKIGPTAHESVVAGGFVDWTRIPPGRMHPLHRKLLEASDSDQGTELLSSDADKDFASYSADSALYHQSRRLDR